jgi:hypothetical protein
MAKKPAWQVEREEREQRIEALAATLQGSDNEIRSGALQALDAYHDAIVARLPAAASAAYESLQAAVLVLNGGTFRGCAAERENGERGSKVVIDDLAKCPAGQVPPWGRLGEFLLVHEGIRVLVRIKSCMSRVMDAELHVIDVDQPFYSETGYRSVFLDPDKSLGLTVPDALRLELADMKPVRLRPTIYYRGQEAVEQPLPTGGEPEWLRAGLDTGHPALPLCQTVARAEPLSAADRQRRRREKKKREREAGLRVELAGAELERIQQQGAAVARLEAEVARLRRETELLELERNKAFQAVDVLTGRLRAAGLSTDHRA